MNVKALLAVLFAVCAPFTGLASVGPALVLARAALREIRADPARQGRRFVALAAVVVSAVGVGMIGVLARAALTEEPRPGRPAEDMPAFIAVVVATVLAGFATWLLVERMTGRVTRAIVAVAGAAVVIGVLAAGFAEATVAIDCVPSCPPPDRLQEGVRAALIAGGAAAGLAASLWALWWVATKRRPSPASEEQVAGIATALEGLRSSTAAFRHPDRRTSSHEPGGDEAPGANAAPDGDEVRPTT